MNEIIVGALGSGLWELVKYLILRLVLPLMRLLPKGKIESGLIFLKHRSLNQEWFESTFQSGNDIFMLTTMSEHTLTDIEGYFRDGKVKVQKLRVLTLSPKLSDDIVDSIARHLGESSQKVKEQISRAYDRWHALEKEYSVLDIRTYSSIPTFHATFQGASSANLEFLTYHTVPSDRASLFLDFKQNPATLNFFKNETEKLWNESKIDNGN